MDGRIKWPKLTTDAKIDQEVLKASSQEVRLLREHEKKVIESRTKNEPELVPNLVDFLGQSLIEFSDLAHQFHIWTVLSLEAELHFKYLLRKSQIKKLLQSSQFEYSSQRLDIFPALTADLLIILK